MLSRILCVLAACFSVQAQTLKTGFFRGQKVTYQIVDGFALTEGDILLGTAEELEPSFTETSKSSERGAATVDGARYRWPELRIPYRVDSNLPNPSRVLDAIAYWNDNTPIKLVPRTNETSYVSFTPKSDVCSSFVGMVGREQAINLGDTCTTGNVIHEIGHAVGLFHEQSRNDRNFYIDLLSSNADKRELFGFAQVLTDGSDTGSYDYGSVMHYGGSAFSRNGLPVLSTIPAGIPIGQRDGLSPGDLHAVRRMYNQRVSEQVISTFPAGLEIIVDGERATSPVKVHWDNGSRHTLAVPNQQTSGEYRYLFGRWSDDGELTHTVTASEDVTVYTANLIRQYRLPLRTSGPGRISVSPASPDGYYPDGTIVEITAVPNPGAYFGGWAGFGAFGVHGISPNPLVITARGPQTNYTAVFINTPPTLITSEPPGLRVDVDGAAVTTPAGFAWAPGTKHTVAVSFATQMTGSATARHKFSGWSDDGEISHSINATDQPQTVAARFSTQYAVTGLSNSLGSVEFSPKSEDDFYDAGTSVQVTPVPTGANRFTGWVGDAAGQPNPATLIIDEQKIVGASFAVPKQIGAASVVNGASFLYPSIISAGEVITIFGLDFGPDSLVTLKLNNSGLADSTLASTRVLVGGVPAPLVYVSPNQISAVVPYSVAGKATTTIQIESRGQLTNARTVAVAPAIPALFTSNSSGSGLAAALNQDGSVNTAGNPASKGSVVVLYGTGEGETNPAGVDGRPTPANVQPRPKLPVRVRVGGREAKVLYAGGAPGLIAGVVQINVEVPLDCPSGAVPVVLLVGDAASVENVSLAVR